MPNDTHQPNGPHARELGRISARLDSLKESVDTLHGEHASMRKDMKKMGERLEAVRSKMFFVGGLLVLISTMAGGMLHKYGILFAP